ncbi:MAG: CDP-alcohol phosphatidyltransferase family protein [Candidatus Cryptobacteroides sp.]
MKTKEITRYIPNLITLGRVPMSVALLYVQSSPVFFWTFYLLCGLSDVLDGAIARRTGTASRFGERLDTIADIVFVAVWMILFMPAINVGRWLWIWVGLIALIKVVNVISGFVMKKGFVAKHTLANKATGLLLFLLPMMIQYESIKVPSIILTCILATFAAIQEGHLIRTEGR